jgi:UDPglucose 6-dehydrogenase
MGDHSEEAKKFAALLNEGAIKENIDSLFTDPEEAEAIKLFSNTYLAMRISYFNELDTYAEINGLNSKKIIEGIGLDSRIGLHYNNPSFGFGGYCLPKDTRQLKANFSNIPNKIIDSIYEANEIRKDFIANSVLSKNPKTVGIYRLVMKSGADNYRDSAMLGLINRIKDKKMTKIIIYEPQISNKISNDFLGCIIINDLKKFKGLSDIIIANRMNEELDDASNKIYTRDLFNIN